MRQCDGQRLQCLILVRDDFWLAISRFLEELETPLVQGRNCAMADLFDPPHARKVLDAFGVAFGKVGWDSVPTNPPADPRNPSQAGRDGVPTYNKFLDQSITALSEEGKIISVRLALFAEMVKSKPWTPQTLQAIGGVEGVGVTFLEETFAASNAPMAYRAHQVAVRGVLKALLPELGTDIKGHQVSRDVLLQASGYTPRPRDFESLLHILDRDLRLITPVDVEGEWGREGEGAKDETRLSVSPSPPPPLSPSSSYQLAHDYLVPSIRAWLTKKQKETWRGRAALRLEERSAQWHRTRERRHFPSLLEFTSIVCGVASRKQTVEQQRMLRAATRHHAVRWGSLLVLIVAVVFGIERHLAERQRVADEKTTETRINVLSNATADGVPFAIEPLIALRELAIPKLRTRMHDTSANWRERSHAAFALANLGDTPSSDAIVTTILDAVPTAANDEAKNMVVAFRDLSRLGLRPDRSGRSPNLQEAIAARANAIDLTDEATRSERLTSKVRYAALALYLGDPSLVSPMLQLGPDPTERTAFTLRLKDWPADLSAVREVLKTTTDESLRSGVVAAIGRFPKETIAEFDALSSVLQELFVTAPDGGSHSAIDWTLRQWNVALPDLKSQISDFKSKQLRPAARRWYTNSVGMTFVEIPVGKYQIGDAFTQTEPIQPVSVKTQYEPHLTALEAVLKEKPDDPQTLLGLGVAHFQLRHDEQAIADLTKMIAKQPNNFYAYQFRAIAHARQKHTEAAREDLEKFEELVTEDTSTKAYVQVLVASFLGDGKVERAALDQRLKERAADPSWLYDGACVYGVLVAQAADDGVVLGYTQRALSLLQSAVAHGYSDLRHMASDADLEALHALAEFRELLQSKPPEVELTRPVYLSNRELTVAQFLAFVNDPNTPAAQKPVKWEGHDKNISQTDDCPMQTINWFDSALYGNWLSRKEGLTPCYQTTGQKLKLKDYDNREFEVDELVCDFAANGYRLPTEAEWEVSCRAETTAPWSCGRDDVELREFAVFNEHSRNQTSSGGTKLPNGWGLFDMHGNVFEWCHDWYGQTVATGRDPQGPQSGSYRVLRGGNWDYTGKAETSATRYQLTPVSRLYYRGVRLAQVPGAGKEKASAGASGAAEGPSGAAR